MIPIDLQLGSSIECNGTESWKESVEWRERTGQTTKIIRYLRGLDS